MPAAAEAPSATVREVRIVEAPPPKAPPAPTRQLTPADIAAMPGDRPGTEPPARPGTLRSRLEAKAKPSGGEVIPTPVPAAPKQPDKPASEATPAAGEQSEPGNATPPPAAQQELDPKTGKPKKANPWKLFEEEKKARATAEQEIQRLKTSIVPEQERTQLMERVTKAESRAKELEDHIRFVSYEKSAEFQEKYQAPYEAAWKRATKELSEITVTGQDGQPRAVTGDDILELVNMPLGTAREVADQVFGKFAGDVMQHRKEIRALFDQQQQALEDARKNGGIRVKQQQEQLQKQQAETTAFVQKAWQAAIDEFAADKVNGDYFKPKSVEDGKELTPQEKEWNEALERGYKLVDDAWGSNAMAPNLTPEQRAAIIKKNVAVRNRAAAFGPMKKLVKHLEAKVAQLEKDLQQYSSSTPGAGGTTPGGRVDTAQSGMDGFRQRLRKLAH